jgi:hypothetical protein
LGGGAGGAFAPKNLNVLNRELGLPLDMAS